jgi:hypothetical protein
MRLASGGAPVAVTRSTKLKTCIIYSDLHNMSASKYFLVMYFKTCNLYYFLEIEIEQPAWKTQAYSKDDN